MAHPLYSPDLSPFDLWLFPTLKRGLRGWQFANDAEVIKAPTGLLNRISEQESNYDAHEMVGGRKYV